jgi:hypothetical protein
VSPRPTDEKIPASRVAQVAFGALVIASLFALFYAQEVKRQPPLLIKTRPGVISFAPLGTGDREAHFHLKASVSGFIEVTIVRADTGTQVAVVASRYYLPRYETERLVWDGREASGGLAPPGTYLVRVHFIEGGQTVIVPYYRLTLRGHA